jgi:hypothetical protein
MKGGEGMARGGATAETAIVAAVRRRLGGQEFCRPADVSAACDLSLRHVYELIESGEIEAVNVGARDSRARWQIHVPSVVAMYQRRSS